MRRSVGLIQNTTCNEIPLVSHTWEYPEVSPEPKTYGVVETENRDLSGLSVFSLAYGRDVEIRAKLVSFGGTQTVSAPYL